MWTVACPNSITRRVAPRAIAAAGAESIRRAKKACRTATSIFDSFHGTDCPIRRINLVVQTGTSPSAWLSSSRRFRSTTKLRATSYALLSTRVFSTRVLRSSILSRSGRSAKA